MLNPNSRSIYIDALRPPDGYVFGYGIGTTFSLDLTSLLIIPLSMALYDYSGEDDLTSNPIAVLDAIRNMADRFIVFCQSGRISVPKKDIRLFNFLEQSVVEANVLRENGVFHPKTWLLKFTGNAPDDIVYRFLCLSRNLTFDKSWDTILTLEGKLRTDRQVGFSRNRPLGDFFNSLRELTRRELTPTQKEQIAQMSDEVRRVSFDPPTNFDDISFMPSGIEGYQKRSNLIPLQRSLIVSPFISEEIFSPLQKTQKRNTIISRIDSFEALSDNALSCLETNADLYYLDDSAEALEVDDSETVEKKHDVKGLHAKLYIAEKGWDATITTGSANATNAAFSGSNVEFMVQLKGKKSVVGIDPFWDGGKNQGSFSGLLCPYKRSDDHVETDPDEITLDNILEETRRMISRANISLKVIENDAGNYDLRVETIDRSLILPAEVEVRCYPISLDETREQTFSSSEGTEIIFKNLTIVSITGFFAFRVTAKVNDKTSTVAFVLNLPISGLPEGRNSFVITSMINNSRNFIRYLLLILSSDPNKILESLMGDSNTSSSSSIGDTDEQAFDDIPLFEELLRASSRNPEKIRQIGALIEEIKRANPENDILPKGFEVIWEAINIGVEE